jgi:hypothetical protein
MKKTQLTLALLVATGLAAVPFAAEAKSHKKHHSSMSSSQTTTGANMKSSKGSDPSGQGGSGPGSDQGGTMTNKNMNSK